MLEERIGRQRQVMLPNMSWRGQNAGEGSLRRCVKEPLLYPYRSLRMRFVPASTNVMPLVSSIGIESIQSP